MNPPEQKTKISQWTYLEILGGLDVDHLAAQRIRDELCGDLLLLPLLCRLLARRAGRRVGRASTRHHLDSLVGRAVCCSKNEALGV